jgi:hypothetical protein
MPTPVKCALSAIRADHRIALGTRQDALGRAARRAGVPSTSSQAVAQPRPTWQ